MTTDTMEMQTVTVDGATKYTIAFGLTNEDGTPMLDSRTGKQKFTNIIADSPEELIKKQALQNLEVARALERSSKRFETLSRKPTVRTAAPEIKAKPLTDDEKVQVGLDIQDPRKAAAAVERVVQSAVPVNEITSEVQRQAKTLDLETRKNIVREFLAKNKEYLPIEANNGMLNRYIFENNLEFSVSSLEFAAAALAPSLVERPRQNASPTPSPQNASPDNAPPNRETPPAQERRAPVTSGIRNSEVSGLPASSTTVLSRQQALDMLYKDRKKYEAWMKDPVKNAILNRALAGR